MHPADAYPADLITAQQAEEEFGIPQQVIRQWATRRRIARYPGRWRMHGTLYARQHIAALAPTYRPTPQRAPHTPAPPGQATGSPPALASPG